MKRSNGLIITGCLALLITLFSFKLPTTITESNSSEPSWKNLKVLPKDISEENLKKRMRGYNDALGVKCSYCHAAGEEKGKLDYASDAKKEKEYARHMILMTQKINAEHFNWDNNPNPETIDAVSCSMCHKGKTTPKR